MKLIRKATFSLLTTLLVIGSQSCSTDDQQEALEEIEQQQEEQQDEQQEGFNEPSENFEESGLTEESLPTMTDESLPSPSDSPDSLATELDKLTSTGQEQAVADTTEDPIQELDSSMDTPSSQSYDAQPTSRLGANAKRYIIQPGDTLAGISRKLYGNSSRWQELADNNGISMPSMIFPGDVLEYEANDHSENYIQSLNKASEEVIMVQEGDTLGVIAERLYGRRDFWKPMWQLNRDTVPNPNLIYSGQILKYFDPKKFDGEAN